MNTYLLSLQRCGHNIAFFPWISIGLCSTLWKYFSLRVEQTSWFSTCGSNVQFVVLFCISLAAMWTQQRWFFQPAASWLLILHLRNHWTNCNQTLVEWSLDGPLSKLCPVIPTSNQDGRQAKNRKKGGWNFNCPLLL